MRYLQQEYDTHKATAVETAEAAVANCTRRYDTANAAIATTDANISSQQAAIRIAETNVSTAEEDVSYTTIRAPMSGTVVYYSLLNKARPSTPIKPRQH